ncbi:MAG: 5'/3'-nucleotidase SurE [Acidobacteria bacterium]|nr:MAG: 5'/3'-nucleotidase SurE [Acidobacteriota bacterium]
MADRRALLPGQRARRHRGSGRGPAGRAGAGSRRLKVLITNDDGYLAEGLRCLAEEIRRWADVVVVSPDGNRSGCGHSITLGRPLRMTKVRSVVEGVPWYMVDGTPTDCVNLGVHHLLEHGEEVAIASGVNHGVNLGDDVTYSGTVGGAFEGHLMGYPAIAVSQELGDGEPDYGRAGRVGSSILRRAAEAGLEVLLNVNVPATAPGLELEPPVVTRLGRRHYKDTVEAREDPRGGTYFWLAGTPQWDESEGSDAAAVRAGRVSVTPIQRDLTSHAELELVEKLFVDRPALLDR